MMNSFTDKTKFFFSTLNSENIQVVDTFYHPDITFIDPLGTHNGIDSLRAYYAKLYSSVVGIEFSFPSIVEKENTIFAAWVMDMRVKKLNGGKQMLLDGVSRIEFDSESGLAIFHQDYFDMNAFIYRYIPAVNLVTSFVNKRLRKS